MLSEYIFMPRPLRERVSVGRVSEAFLFGAYAAPNPAPVFFLLVAMPKERILDKKEKHAYVQRCKATQDRMDVVKCSRI